MAKYQVEEIHSYRGKYKEKVDCPWIKKVWKEFMEKIMWIVEQEKFNKDIERDEEHGITVGEWTEVVKGSYKEC